MARHEETMIDKKLVARDRRAKKAAFRRALDKLEAQGKNVTRLRKYA
jgi:hypothetical protein